jgi:EAL domain-containing protein (putative c-di-GMP-specific phosphodiesterase class I)
LDDFGTGHSSLEALHRYPIGTMKIDRSFISQMHASEQSTRIVESSIRLAHSLNLDVVAEGVETEIERQALVALGCEYGQGWLFGKPASVRTP